jgi:uncharacterized protein with GYD domain
MPLSGNGLRARQLSLAHWGTFKGSCSTPAVRLGITLCIEAGGGGGMTMNTYISLINWTDEGIRHFRDTTQRAEDFSKLVENSGGRVRDLLWTVGEYDAVCITDFPDDEAGVAALLQMGSAGHIRSSTLRAFGADEMRAIINRTS